MEILDKLRACKTDSELVDFIETRIAKCIKEGNDINDGFEVIGEMVEVNTKREILLEDSEDASYDNYDINIFWKQFIPPNVKIVFCLEYPGARHNGYYYYMGDFEYIFSFISGIMDKEINDEIDLVSYIYLFLRHYFGCSIERDSRDKLFKLLEDINGDCYLPNIKRSITLFKGRSIAQCTEFGALAQNLLSFFGVESLYIHDNLHAYNIVEFPGEEEDRSISVVDFASGIFNYDLVTNTRMPLPFIADIPDYTDEMLREIMETNKRLEFNDYRLFTLGHTVIEQTSDVIRTYGSCGNVPEEKKKILH